MIETHLHEGVFEVVFDNPPVNALSAKLRTGLAVAVADALADEAVTAIVLRGGKSFSAGADITEFDKPLSPPLLQDIIEILESGQKPIVAAIAGNALGGGLELALGCHYRIAAPGTRLGLPEVLLGILPGAGGTQRLPRLIGVEAALDMIVSGAPVSADKALAIGLVDQLASDNASLAADAIAYARTLTGPRRTGDLTVSADPAIFDKFAADNARKIANLRAPKACIESVRAATVLTLKEGLAKETELFLRLLKGDQSIALRHIFAAERTAAKIYDLPKVVSLRPIAKVGMVGAGTMGGGIAMNFLSAGVPVVILDLQQDALDRGVGVVRKNYDASSAKGRLTNEQVENAMGLLTPTLDFTALADCDLIIEAVYESMDIKKEVFSRLDSVAKPGAILASNTSLLSIDEIAAATGRPGDVLGLHFFSPANVMKLLEVVRGAETAADVLATVMNLARRIGKVPVVSRVCYGFIGNRMLDPRQTNAEALLLEGATPTQIDRVHNHFGMAMGPFEMIDLAGVDIGWHRDPSRIEGLKDALCAEGRWGQKTKAGFYDYDDRRKATPSPLVCDIVENLRKKTGTALREISEEEIVVRTLYTMVNEGAKILEEGIAQRASDIDVVWVYGYGWPRYRGGPMFWANQVGLKKIVDGLTRYAARMGRNFTLSPLLVRCAQHDLALDRSVIQEMQDAF